jgi:hypothetical protein
MADLLVRLGGVVPSNFLQATSGEPTFHSQGEWSCAGSSQASCIHCEREGSSHRDRALTRKSKSKQFGAVIFSNSEITRERYSIRLCTLIVSLLMPS